MASCVLTETQFPKLRRDVGPQREHNSVYLPRVPGQRGVGVGWGWGAVYTSSGPQKSKVPKLEEEGCCTSLLTSDPRSRCLDIELWRPEFKSRLHNLPALAPVSQSPGTLGHTDDFGKWLWRLELISLTWYFLFFGSLMRFPD